MVFGYVYEAGARERNEDALLFRSSLFAEGELVFAAVCDGMGGMGNGMEASSLCIREMETWYDRELLPCISGAGKKACNLERVIKSKGFCLYRRINRMLFDKMRHEGKSMGTTAVMCIIYKGRYYLFHLGDSRGYLLGNGWGIFSGRQLTKDHGNEKGLSRCLGLNRQWEPDFCRGRLGRGAMLLCTDGFWRKSDRRIWKKCMDRKKMTREQVIGKRLKEIACYNMRMGETDNISALFIG